MSQVTSLDTPSAATLSWTPSPGYVPRFTKKTTINTPSSIESPFSTASSASLDSPIALSSPIPMDKQTFFDEAVKTVGTVMASKDVTIEQDISSGRKWTQAPGYVSRFKKSSPASGGIGSAT